MNIGKKVKMLRTDLELTQEQLALKIGYSGKDMISKIEKNQVVLPIDKLILLAKTLGCSVSYLIDEKPLADTRHLDASVADDDFNLVYLCSLLSDDNKKLLFDIINSMLKLQKK